MAELVGIVSKRIERLALAMKEPSDGDLGTWCGEEVVEVCVNAIGDLVASICRKVEAWASPYIARQIAFVTDSSSTHAMSQVGCGCQSLNLFLRVGFCWMCLGKCVLDRGIGSGRIELFPLGRQSWKPCEKQRKQDCITFGQPCHQKGHSGGLFLASACMCTWALLQQIFLHSIAGSVGAVVMMARVWV